MVVGALGLAACGAFASGGGLVKGANDGVGIVVDCDIPAGNVVVESVEGDTVKVRQDLRDTTGSWFYWAFRVRGAAGKTVRFEFTNKEGGGPVGVRGPVVSKDGGKTFSYPLDGKSKSDAFTYTFAADENETLFYECHPYVRAHWDAFVAGHAKDVAEGRMKVEVLCKSRKGADVPCARVGCINREPKRREFVSCRHHCSETTGSWVVEGIVNAFLADDEVGKWLCEKVEPMDVPFVDYDGVQAGDQGKNRRPHDHNRDYSEFIYPETKALTEWIASHAGGKLDVFIDIHCPWIRGDYNEFVYTPRKDPAIVPDAAMEDKFSAYIEKIQKGSLRYRAADDLQYGVAWNKGANYTQGWASVIWACKKVKGLRVSRTFEIPFATANGAVVTPEACEEFGRDVARAVRECVFAE